MEDLPFQNMSLEKFISAKKFNQTGYVLRSNIFTVNDHPVYWIMYSYINSDDKRQLVGLQHWMISSDKAYAITYLTDRSTFYYNLPKIIEMVASFKFAK